MLWMYDYAEGNNVSKASGKTATIIRPGYLDCMSIMRHEVSN